MTESLFKVDVSTDGGRTWIPDPALDSDQYFHAARNCRSQSKLAQRHLRIRRPHLGDKVLVVFFDGMPVPLP